MKELFYQYTEQELDQFARDAQSAIANAKGFGENRTGRSTYVHVLEVPSEEEIKGSLLLGLPVSACCDGDYYNPCTGTHALWAESNGMNLYISAYDEIIGSVPMPKPAGPALQGTLYHTVMDRDANGNMLVKQKEVLCTKKDQGDPCYALVDDIVGVLRQWFKEHLCERCGKCPYSSSYMPKCVPSETELAWKIAEGKPFTVPDGCRMFGTGKDGGWFFEEKDGLVLTHSNGNGGAVIHTYLFVPAE